MVTTSALPFLSDTTVAHVASYCANAEAVGTRAMATTPYALRDTGLTPEEIARAGSIALREIALEPMNAKQANLEATLTRAQAALGGELPRFAVADVNLAEISADTGAPGKKTAIELG